MYYILRNLKTLELNMSFLVFLAVWHLLLPLSSLNSLRYLCPDKSDNSLFILQGFCATGRVVMDGESLGILALVKIIQIYLRQIAR